MEDTQKTFKRNTLIKLMEDVNDPKVLKDIPSEFRDDKELLLAGIQKIGHDTLQIAEKSLLSDKDFMIDCVKLNGHVLQYADDELKKDKELVLTAVSTSWFGFSLQFADESLRKDKEVVLAALKSYSDAIDYVDDSLKDDPDVKALIDE